MAMTTLAHAVTVASNLTGVPVASIRTGPACSARRIFFALALLMSGNRLRWRDIGAYCGLTGDDAESEFTRVTDAEWTLAENYVASQGARV